MTDMADAEALGLDPQPLERLVETVEAHIAEWTLSPAPKSPSPGADGSRSTGASGRARLDPPKDAEEGALWLLFSNTKVITAAAVWKLVAEGRLQIHRPGRHASAGFRSARQGTGKACSNC